MRIAEGDLAIIDSDQRFASAHKFVLLTLVQGENAPIACCRVFLFQILFPQKANSGFLSGVSGQDDFINRILWKRGLRFTANRVDCGTSRLFLNHAGHLVLQSVSAVEG